jgi:hypothetical protein
MSLPFAFASRSKLFLASPDPEADAEDLADRDL